MGRYLYAVFAVSLFLHLVLFWPGPQRLVPPVATTFVVRLVDRPAAKDNPEVGESKPKAEDAQTRGEALEGTGRVAERVVPLQGVSGPRQIAMMEGRPVTGAKASVEPPSPFAADTLAAPVSSKVLDDDEETAWIRRYRLALAIAAVRLQYAPGRGTASRGAGQSVVVVHFRSGGALPEIRLSESSGQSVLDDGALDLIRRAVLEVPAPAQNQPFSVVLPVLFETM